MVGEGGVKSCLGEATVAVFGFETGGMFVRGRHALSVLFRCPGLAVCPESGGVDAFTASLVFHDFVLIGAVIFLCLSCFSCSCLCNRTILLGTIVLA